MGKRKWTLSWLLASVVVWALGVGEVASAEKFVLLLDWFPYGKHAPLIAGVEKGIFKAVGVDLTIQRGFGSADTVKRIAAEEGNFGLSDMGSIILGRAEGARVKTLGIFADKGLLVAYALKSSGIRKISDLKGKTVGDTPGGAGIRMFPAVAAASGLKEGDWKVMSMDPAAKNPSLLAKSVDAILTVHAIYPALNVKAKGMGDEVVIMLYRDYGLDIYSHGWLANERTIAAKPDPTRRFMKGLTESLAWMMENPEAGMDIFLAKNPTATRKFAMGEWEIQEDALVTETAKKHGLGYIDRERMKKTIDTIDRYIGLKRPVRPEEVYTNEFLPGIKPPAKKAM